jgi:transporter family-2 protein
MGPPKFVAGKEAFSRESWRVATWPYYLFAVVAGAMLPFQFGINSVLARYADGAARATLISFLVGTLSLLIAVLVFFRGLPSGEKLASAPWWVWIGGAMGAFYVLGGVVTAPKLGAATLVALILAGQAAASLTVDHFGLVGFTESPVTPGRLAGIGLVAVGVVLVRVL